MVDKKANKAIFVHGLSNMAIRRLAKDSTALPAVSNRKPPCILPPALNRDVVMTHFDEGRIDSHTNGKRIMKVEAMNIIGLFIKISIELCTVSNKLRLSRANMCMTCLDNASLQDDIKRNV